jgi:2-dehydro-3-deoxy-L-rhamnonate dehydrogenase (NAD+)
VLVISPWRRVFSINCDGVFYANRAAARVMVPRAYGRIVDIASIAFDLSGGRGTY